MSLRDVYFGDRIHVMASRAVESGPTSRQVAANILRIRRERGLEQREVSARLSAIGRPMLSTVVSKVERGERRVDVDDLMAFSVVLGVSPSTLLLPDRAGVDPVEVTGAGEVPGWLAWEWMDGTRPLELPDDPAAVPRAMHAYMRAARPVTDAGAYLFRPNGSTAEGAAFIHANLAGSFVGPTGRHLATDEWNTEEGGSDGG